ncbi:MAG TPA: hypothetical protein VGL44_08545 [Gaiellales bacterium]
MPPSPPLATLLSQPLVAFTIEFDNVAEERITAAGRRPWIASLAMWADYLRHVGEDGIPARELRSRAFVSAKTLRSRLGALSRWRYVTVGLDEVVRLTPAGRRARVVWLALAAEIEARWCERFGCDRVEELRGALAPVLADAGHGLPAALPIVAYALFSEVVPGPGPVAREPLPDLDVSVLLARALLVLTLEFERDSRLSLPMCADGLRVLGSEPVRVRDLPRAGGGSKEAMAIIAGHLARVKLAAVEPDPGAARGKVVRLTARGLAARAAYARRLAGVEEHLRERIGAAAVDRLRQALEALLADPAFADGLVPPAGGWRGQPPYLAHTERLIADPRGALPHQPLMLHRGGFPDGA